MSDFSVLLPLLKEYLGIDPNDTTDDAKLTKALNSAGAAIETYLDRIIPKQSVDEYFAHHFGTVVLHDFPVDTTVEVLVNLNGAAQTDYKIYQDNARLGHLSRIGHRPDMPMDWRIYDQVTVTYTAGYDPIPTDLADAIVYLAGLVYNNYGTGSIPGGGGSGDVKSMTIHDVGSMTFDVGSSSSGDNGGAFPAAGAIPDAAAEMVSRYKRMSA